MDILPGHKQLAPCHCLTAGPRVFCSNSPRPQEHPAGEGGGGYQPFRRAWDLEHPGCQTPAPPPLRLLALPPPLPCPGPSLLTGSTCAGGCFTFSVPSGSRRRGGVCAVTSCGVQDHSRPPARPLAIGGRRTASPLLCPPPGARGRPGATPACRQDGLLYLPPAPAGCFSFRPRQTRSGTLRMFGTV